MSSPDIFIGLSEKLVPGKYCAIIVSDFKHGGRFYPFHSDLYGRLDAHGLELQGVTVLHQTHKALYPYGYPFAYVPNIHHQYIVLLRRPKAPARRVCSYSACGCQQTSTPPWISPNCCTSTATWPRATGGTLGTHLLVPLEDEASAGVGSGRSLSLPDSVVLDPFGGSGTIPLEAAFAGAWPCPTT